MNFLHYGVPTHEKIESLDYSYVEPLKLFTTNPNVHDKKIQFVYADKDSPLPAVVKMSAHISIGVENMEEELIGFDNIEYGHVQLNEKLSIAFATKDGVLFELMETK